MARGTRGGVDVPFPVRGTSGGWRDWWDDPDDSAELRARVEATERQQTQRAEVLGVAWRQELAGTPDASLLMQRSAGHEPEHCLRPAGR
jgi:hypothetical protein